MKVEDEGKGRVNSKEEDVNDMWGNCAECELRAS